MSDDTLVPTSSTPKLSPASSEWLEQVERVEALSLTTPQLPLVTEHLFHAGMYARTARIPAGSILTGALMRIATVLVIHGNATFHEEGHRLWIEGYAVIPGSAGRKTLLVAYSPVEMTMLFPTKAKTVREAEIEFTADYECLMSRESDNDTLVVTGE